MYCRETWEWWVEGSWFVSFFLWLCSPWIAILPLVLNSHLVDECGRLYTLSQCNSLYFSPFKSVCLANTACHFRLRVRLVSFSVGSPSSQSRVSMNLPLLLTVHFIFKKVLILYSLERSSLVILISFQRLCILFPSLFQGYCKGRSSFSWFLCQTHEKLKDTWNSWRQLSLSLSRILR